MDLTPFLEDLESRIDPAVEDELIASWRTFVDLRCPDPVFHPARRRVSPPRLAWPRPRTNAAQLDPDAMLLEQYCGCSDLLASGAGRVMMVRANYGTPTLAMPFGAELFLMPEETNTLPASRPLGTAAVRAFLERGEKPSSDHPYLQKVYATGRRFAEVARKYPRIGKYVGIYHPDTQGPLDIVEMVWGSEVFTALFDEPETVHRLLNLVVDLYIAVMHKWIAISPLSFHGMGIQWGLLYRSGIMLRDDSAMNLSPAMFEEFMLPYDCRLLKTFGGGAMHSCGRVEHFIPFLHQMPGLHAFNMSQPHLNDMEKVWQATVDRGIVLVGFDSTVAQNAKHRLSGRVQT